MMSWSYSQKAYNGNGLPCCYAIHVEVVGTDMFLILRLILPFIWIEKALKLQKHQHKQNKIKKLPTKHNDGDIDE